MSDRRGQSYRNNSNNLRGEDGRSPNGYNRRGWNDDVNRHYYDSGRNGNGNNNSNNINSREQRNNQPQRRNFYHSNTSNINSNNNGYNDNGHYQNTPFPRKSSTPSANSAARGSTINSRYDDTTIVNGSNNPMISTKEEEEGVFGIATGSSDDRKKRLKGVNKDTWDKFDHEERIESQVRINLKNRYCQCSMKDFEYSRRINCSIDGMILRAFIKRNSSKKKIVQN